MVKIALLIKNMEASRSPGYQTRPSLSDAGVVDF